MPEEFPLAVLTAALALEPRVRVALVCSRAMAPAQTPTVVRSKNVFQVLCFAGQPWAGSYQASGGVPIARRPSAHSWLNAFVNAAAAQGGCHPCDRCSRSRVRLWPGCRSALLPPTERRVLRVATRGKNRRGLMRCGADFQIARMVRVLRKVAVVKLDDLSVVVVRGGEHHVGNGEPEACGSGANSC